MSTSPLPLVIQALFPGETLNVGYPFFHKNVTPAAARSDPDAVDDWRCSQLALLVYLDDNAARERLINASGMRVAGPPLRDRELRAIVTTLGDTAYVAVRGTVFPAPLSTDLTAYADALRNWSTNLQADLAPLNQLLAPHAEGRVHAGFQSALMRLHPLVQNALAAVPKPREIIFTGHSLGGALAVLLAMTINLPGGVARRIVSFGAPRLGDGRLADAIELEHRCYQHGADLVADLPPKPWPFLTWVAAGYADYPQRIALAHVNPGDTSLKNAEVLLAPVLNPRVSAAAAARPLAPPDNFLVDLALGRVIDHAMALYAEQCGRKL